MCIRDRSDNDRWFGEFTVTTVGRWEYTIEAYAERYLSWVDEISKKSVPGADLRSELLEGCLLYTSDAADERSSVDLGGRRIIKKKKNIEHEQ